MADTSIANAFLECAGKPYTIRSAREIMAMSPCESRFWLGTIPVGEYGASGAIVAPPGLGKSRFVLQAAVHQICGLPFCGLHLDPTPRRTLIIQSENSLPRLQKDLSGFRDMLNEEQCELLNEYLFITSLESDLDGDITIDEHDPSSENFIRLKTAIALTNPEVVIIDPWSAACVDELSSSAIRLTYMALRKAAASANAPVTIVLVCHAKPGLAAAASARGSDALGYARGNRNLVGIMRSVINLRNCEFVDDKPVDVQAGSAVQKGIEIIFAKSNNGILPDPLAIRLNPATFIYEQIPDFPHQTWQETLDKMAKSNATQSPAAKAAETAAALTSVQERVANLLDAQGPMGRTALVQKLVELGISSSKRSAVETVKWLCENGQLKMHQPKPNRPARYYTPKQFKEAVG